MLKSRKSPKSKFVGKIVLVTGAASGLGRALAVAFARAGSDLVLADVNEEGLRETAGMAEVHGRRCLVKRVDVSDRAGMEALAREVLAEWGRVDILVNNAGISVGGELRHIPLEEMERIVGVNLMGPIYGTRLFLPGMVERGEGHIVNISSQSGLVVLPLHIAYTTTKYGVRGFTEALWAEARCHGVDVTHVCPAGIKTNIMEATRMYPDPPTERVKKGEEWWRRYIMNKGMEPDEAARRILEAVEKSRFLALLRGESYLLYYLARFFPGAMLRLVSAITRYVVK